MICLGIQKRLLIPLGLQETKILKKQMEAINKTFGQIILLV